MLQHLLGILLSALCALRSALLSSMVRGRRRFVLLVASERSSDRRVPMALGSSVRR